MARNLTLLGNPTFSTGKFGLGLASGYGQVPNGVFNRGPFSDWTIEWWGKRVSASNGLFVSSLNDSFNQWYVGHDGRFATFNGITTARVVGDGLFHHFRLVLLSLSGVQVLYVDGVCAGAMVVRAPGAGETNRSYIGAIWSGTGEKVYVSSPVVVDECAVFGSALSTGTSVGTAYFSPPAAPYSGNETGLVALWHLDGDGLEGARVVTSVSATDSALLYSPGNWSKGTTVNPGAYVSVLYRNSSSIVLYFDVNGGSYAQIAYRFDGGPFMTAAVAPEVVLTAPPSRPQPRLLEVVFKSNFVVYFAPVVGSSKSLTLSAIGFSAGASISRPPARPTSALVFGDSITVGARAVANTGADPDDNDATVSYAFGLRDALNAEVGVIAFPGTGVQTSTPYAPALIYSYPWVYEGAARSFSALTPTLVIFLEGFNDGSAPAGSVAAGLAAVISAIGSASPATRFLVLGDVGGNRSSEARAAASATGASYSALLVSILAATDDTLDDVHPTATAHVTKLLPAVARAVRESDLSRLSAWAWEEPTAWEPTP